MTPCWNWRRSIERGALHSGQIVLTAKHTRKLQPGLYEQPWSTTCDFTLVRDLVEACRVPDLGDQAMELMYAMQVGEYEAERCFAMYKPSE